MQTLRNLWGALDWLRSARDLTIESKTYQWEATPPATFFLDVEASDVRLKRHAPLRVIAKVELQAGFGWQMAAEQDAAGIYLIARRKPLIGAVGRGRFDITLPPSLHVTLKLRACRLQLIDLNTTLDFPPQP